MPDRKTLDEHYRNLTDEELLKLRGEGGFTAEAEQVFDDEFARRGITPDEIAQHVAPLWLVKAEVGTVGIITLGNGNRITAEVVGLNEERDQLTVNMIPQDGAHRKGHRAERVVPVSQIASFEPQSYLAEQWPYSDPCRGRRFSPSRFALMTAIFLCLTVGSLPLFLTLMNKPFGFQCASMIAYTLFEVFFTFARTGSRGGPDIPPFMFTCPAVEPQIPRLLWRHLGFLVAFFAFQTGMLAARTHLPEWWNLRDRKGTTPFDLVLLLLCFGLAYAQVFSNRSTLNRAHRDFSTQNTG